MNFLLQPKGTTESVKHVNHIEDGLETIPFQINSEEDLVKGSTRSQVTTNQNRVENQFSYLNMVWLRLHIRNHLSRRPANKKLLQEMTQITKQRQILKDTKTLPGLSRDSNGALVLPHGKKTPVPQDLPLEPACWCERLCHGGRVLHPLSHPSSIPLTFF